MEKILKGLACLGLVTPSVLEILLGPGLKSGSEVHVDATIGCSAHKLSSQV